MHSDDRIVHENALLWYLSLGKRQTQTMTSKKIKLIWIIFMSVVAGISYWQYQFYRTPIIENTELTIEEQMVSGGPHPEGIPSIDRPIFESVAAADQYLDDYGLGLLVVVNAQARFYPYQILVWHQVVNETFGGQPLLITYCPLTNAGMVFDRMINGKSLQFGVSGKLLNNNLLMSDEVTNSLWSQMLGKAVVGEAISQTLTPYPALTVSWNVFKKWYSNGQVLSRETGFVRDYTRNPYADYENSHAVFFPVGHDDARLASKELVYGYVAENDQIAFSKEVIEKQGFAQVTVGSIPIIVWWDQTRGTLRGFFRSSISGSEISFYQDGDDYIDEQTGSVWNRDGEAVSGSYRGQKLEPIVLTLSYWFAWSAMYPETALWNSFN